MELSQRLMMNSAAPALARRSLDRFSGLVQPDRMDDLRLVVSELVTNCISHSGLDGRAWIKMTVEMHGPTIRVEISDQGLGFGHDPEASLREGGWGLAIVEALAQRWGHEKDPDTRVWAELSIR